MLWVDKTSGTLHSFETVQQTLLAAGTIPDSFMHLPSRVFLAVFSGWRIVLEWLRHTVLGDANGTNATILWIAVLVPQSHVSSLIVAPGLVHGTHN